MSITGLRVCSDEVKLSVAPLGPGRYILPKEMTKGPFKAKFDLDPKKNKQSSKIGLFRGALPLLGEIMTSNSAFTTDGSGPCIWGFPVNSSSVYDVLTLGMNRFLSWQFDVPELMLLVWKSEKKKKWKLSKRKRPKVPTANTTEMIHMDSYGTFLDCQCWDLFPSLHCDFFLPPCSGSMHQNLSNGHWETQRSRFSPNQLKIFETLF